MKIYLAGPMRGYPLYNFAAFFAAAMHLREMGHEVINPAEMDMGRGFNPSLPLDDPNQIQFDMKSTLKKDFEEILLKAEAVAFLPGWRNSTGAKAERVVAHYSGKEIYFYEKNTGLLPMVNELPHIDFHDLTPRLWDSLPGVKAIRLTLVGIGDNMDGSGDADGVLSYDDLTAEVMVDIIDSDTGEILYTFGKMTLENGGQFIAIKLDAEVVLEKEATLDPKHGKLIPGCYAPRKESKGPVMPEVKIEEEI